MNRKEFLDSLFEILRIPSVSTQDKYLPNMHKARNYLVKLFQSMGFETKILKGKKHAAVFSQLTTHNSLPTVLIYGHYDVQPPEPLNEWETPPFEPTLKNKVLYGRGTTDDKGQIMIHLMTIKNMLEKGGKLPVNFKFLIEGEEEIGSISVESIVKRYAKELFGCDYMIVSDSEMVSPNTPTIEIALRGLIYTEITLVGSGHDIHSGLYGGLAENPANALATILNQLKNDQNEITVPHFYDDVVPFSKIEKSDFNRIKTTEKDITKESSLFSLGGGEKSYSINERRWLRPTMDVNGLTSGYQGEGSKTIIPATASAKVSFRLVPNQNPEKIYQSYVEYLKSLSPKSLKLKVRMHASALPYKSPTTNPVFTLAKKALKYVFNNETVYAASGGSIGFVPIMVKALGVPCILIGFAAPGNNAHGPNESFPIDNYFKGIEAMNYFYSNLKK